MKKILFLIILSSFNSLLGQSQNCGFESGTTAGWKLSNGKLTDDGVVPVFSDEVMGTVGGGHIITNKKDGNDPKITSEKIPMVAPGSNYSIRFGDINLGGSFFRITKSFTVTKETVAFQYQFAVVFQEDSRGHETFQKPGFSVEVLDAYGQKIDCACYDLQLEANSTTGFYKQQGDLYYLNWTTVEADLGGWIGQTVTFQATVHGCTKAQHFGYAYFNANCFKQSEIKVENACTDGSGYLTLSAPDGYDKYYWSATERTRSIKVTAQLGTKFSVLMAQKQNRKRFKECWYFLEYTIKKNEIPVVIDTSICSGKNYILRGKTYNTTGTYLEKVVNSAFCDSIYTLNLNVIPIAKITKNINLCEGEQFTFKGNIYNTSGTYFKTISSTAACDSIFTINVKITNIARATKNFSLCQGQKAKIGDSTYSKPGRYLTTIKRAGLCDSVVTSTIDYENLIARFTKNFSLCEGEKAKVGDSTYSKTGTFVTTIKRMGLCDSVVTSTLSYENLFSLTVSPETTIGGGENAEIKVDVQPPGTYSFDWTPKETLVCNTCASTLAQPPTTTKYTVSVSLPGSRCSKKIQTQVRVYCGLYVPTAFTPNNDQTNDIFYVVGSKCVKLIKELSIYDRWGELVFRDENFLTADSAHGWDGSFRGKSLNPDTFTYKIIAEMKNGEVNDFSGAFRLLR